MLLSGEQNKSSTPEVANVGLRWHEVSGEKYVCLGAECQAHLYCVFSPARRPAGAKKTAAYSGR